MAMLRSLLGDALRRTRQSRQLTLRDVSATARVSLGYLSEVERGQKEASSELLASICTALDVRMQDVLREVCDAMDLSELSGLAAAELQPAAPGARRPAAGERVLVRPVVIPPVKRASAAAA